MTATDTPATRLESLYDLRRRIDLEIERETRFQSRMKRLEGDTRIAIATRGDWSKRLVIHVAEHYGVKPADILGKRRGRRVSEARHVTSWLLRESGRTYPEIGRALLRDHTSAMYGVKRVDREPRLFSVAANLLAELHNERVA